MISVLSWWYCSIVFIFIPGRNVFFTETFEKDEDGVLGWVSDGGEAVFAPHVNRNTCQPPVASAWFDG